ncbi:MAG: transcription termination factor Rho [Roseibacillus sp.]
MADEPSDLIQTEFESADTPSPPKKKTPGKKAVKAAAKKTAKKATKKTAKKAATKKAAAKKKTIAKPEVEAPAPEQAAPKKEVQAQPKAKKPSRPESASKPAPKKLVKKPAKKAAARKILAVPEGMKPVKEKEEPTLEVVEETPPSENRENIPRRNGRPMGRVKGGPVGKGTQGNDDRRQGDRRNPKHRDEESGNRGSKFQGEPYEVSGLLETTPKGFGFLREPEGNYEQSKSDVFISPDLIQEHALRAGQVLTGKAQKGPRGPQLVSIDNINGASPEEAKSYPHFDELKAVFPDKRIGLETTPERFTTRVLDILAPVGRGQRGLIVSPPRAGKTTLLLHIAEAVQELHSETMHLMVCLVDERPEEVTEFRRQLPDAEIYASSNDEPARNHCRLAELCIERAKRLVEAGQHVFLVMDSITRLARAYNNTMGGSKKGRGRGIQSGGIMAGALEEPRRLFAAARNTREAGSLTILGTALIQTNSKADEAIFMEFKGTGNMELVLDRRIAEHFVYPAVDLFKSGTRREELLLPEHTLNKINLIRRGLAGHRPIEAMERLLFFLKKFPNNAQMLMEIKG